MSIEFDFVWNGRTSKDELIVEWFFRIGADANRGGNGCFGNLNRYPALSITSDSPPYLRFYLAEEEACSTHYDLDGFGTIAKGESYHFVAFWSHSSLAIEMNSDKNIWTQQWPRNRTADQFIGDVVPVWWMSNKFGSTQYQPANGTFSDITIRSTVTNPDTTASPTSTPSPTAPTAPTSKSTPSPTSESTPAPTEYVVSDGSVQIQTTSHNTLNDSDRIDDEQNADSTSSPLLYIIIGVAVAALLLIAIPVLLWLRKKRTESSNDDIEIKHLSMMYLGTGHNGEVSPPSGGGGTNGFHDTSDLPSPPGRIRPRNMQNLPDLPLSPKMVPGDRGSNVNSDDDDMKSPILLEDEREDDEIEDMYPEMGQMVKKMSEREGRIPRRNTAGFSGQQKANSFQPPSAPTRGRGPLSLSALPKSAPFMAVKTQSSASHSDMSVTPAGSPRTPLDTHGDNVDTPEEVPFMITVDGVEPELASDEELVDNIDDDMLHHDESQGEQFDDVMGADWTDGAESVVIGGRDSGSLGGGHETKGLSNLGLNGLHRLHHSQDSGPLVASLQVKQSVASNASNFSDNEVVDGDLWTAGGPEDEI